MLQDASSPAASAHFVNSHSRDALASTYRWKPTSNALATLVPDARHSVTPLTAAFHAPNAAAAHSFGNALHPTMDALAPSFNHSSIVRAIVNPHSLPTLPSPHQPQHTVASSSPQAVKHPHAHTHTHQTLKKPRSTSVPHVAAHAHSAHVPAHKAKPAVSAPLTSPVSTSTIPNVKSPLGPVAPSVQNRLTRDSDHPFKSHSVNRLSHHLTDDASTPLTPSLLPSSAPAVASPLIVPHNKPIDNITHVRSHQLQQHQQHQQRQASHLIAPPSRPQLKHSLSVAASPSAGDWGAKRSKNSGSRARSRRKTTNGPTIPVHLRNPKKGRARVFRECVHCGTENHIRRSDCVSCQKPLPPGKRRRDGNIMFDRQKLHVSKQSASGNGVCHGDGIGSGSTNGFGVLDTHTNNKALSGGSTNKALQRSDDG
ncbi:unnamed protein product [Agarophyton chilense]